MVDHLANGVCGAHIGRARRPTLLTEAGLVLGTLRADHTFGPAIWRHADVVGLARAHRVLIHHMALTVRAAR